MRERRIRVYGALATASTNRQNHHRCRMKLQNVQLRAQGFSCSNRDRSHNPVLAPSKTPLRSISNSTRVTPILPAPVEMTGSVNQELERPRSGVWSLHQVQVQVMHIHVQAQRSRLQVRGGARHARRDRLTMSKRNFMQSSGVLFRLDLRLPSGMWMERRVRTALYFQPNSRNENENNDAAIEHGRIVIVYQGSNSISTGVVKEPIASILIAK
ncbi:hypothetical protein GALMADRAFT_879110 [Galerina marginata CBS 339.88]|uniref:Uncharacterized protein n=1 Tax=Galerina marginata (strain CBS 339.88) TaxID=685588 RepID=A0A067SKL9_GALM3|nr:hypothetical protein GALMADRAFT_879110 [Galerina marginata CBS 339.88]